MSRVHSFRHCDDEVDLLTGFLMFTKMRALLTATIMKTCFSRYANHRQTGAPRNAPDFVVDGEVDIVSSTAMSNIHLSEPAAISRRPPVWAEGFADPEREYAR